MNKLVIIIPIYRNFITIDEEISLKLAVKKFRQFDIIVISPQSLSQDEKYLSILEKYRLASKYFKNFFFNDISGYNKLMLDLNFYEAFDNFKFMLICQLDALVFSNNLEYWINKEYDYVGAPWIISKGDKKIIDSMGNGGLSLRNISKFIQVLKSKDIFFSEIIFLSTPMRAGLKYLVLLKFLSKIKKMNIRINYLNIFLKFYKNNEDAFWAFYAVFFVNDFKLSNIEDALKFSFDEEPIYCFTANNNNMPFGCHAWKRYDHHFWEDKLRKLEV